MGASYNGSTTVSKTVCVGSIPTAPAKSSCGIGHLGFDIFSGPIVYRLGHQVLILKRGVRLPLGLL